jgi:hypothetical protein
MTAGTTIADRRTEDLPAAPDATARPDPLSH